MESMGVDSMIPKFNRLRIRSTAEVALDLSVRHKRNLSTEEWVQLFAVSESALDLTIKQKQLDQAAQEAGLVRGTCGQVVNKTSPAQPCESAPLDNDNHLPTIRIEETRDFRDLANEFFQFGNVIIYLFQPDQIPPKAILILQRNVTFSADQLFMQRHNIAHFMSLDYEAHTTIAKSLKELNY